MQPVSQPELHDLSRYIGELEITLEENKKAGLEWKQKLSESQDTIQRTSLERDALVEEVTALRDKCENLSLLVEGKDDGAAMLQLTQKLDRLQETLDRVTKENVEHQQALLAKARTVDEMLDEVTRARALSLTLQHEIGQRDAFERLLARLLDLNRENCALWGRIKSATTRSPTTTTTTSATAIATVSSSAISSSWEKPECGDAMPLKTPIYASADRDMQSNSNNAAATSNPNSPSKTGLAYRANELLVHKLVSFAFEGTGGGGMLHFHYARHALTLASFRTHFASVTNVFQHVLPDTDYFDLV
jgi:chromosome segregation ATPase